MGGGEISLASFISMTTNEGPTPNSDLDMPKENTDSKYILKLSNKYK